MGRIRHAKSAISLGITTKQKGYFIIRNLVVGYIRAYHFMDFSGRKIRQTHPRLRQPFADLLTKKRNEYSIIGTKDRKVLSLDFRRFLLMYGDNHGKH